MVIRNARGAIAPLMILLMMAGGIAGFGTWMLLREWRLLVQKQLGLDQCVARTALKLRDTLNTVEIGNAWISAIREVEGVASLLPPVRAALVSATYIPAAFQEEKLLVWRVESVKWLAQRGCPAVTGAHNLPLPSLKLLPRVYDDEGADELKWMGEEPTEFSFQISSRPRLAAARVFVAGTGGTDGTSDDKNNEESGMDWTKVASAVQSQISGIGPVNHWKAEWKAPKRDLLSRI